MQGINPTMLLWFINHLHNFFVLYPAAFIRCRTSRNWHSPSQDKFMTGASPRSHCSSCLSDPRQPLHITPASRVAKIQTYLSQLFCLFLSFKQWGPDLYQSSTCKSETESQSHHHKSTLLPVSQGLHLATAQHLDIEIHATAKPSPRSHRVKKTAQAAMTAHRLSKHHSHALHASFECQDICFDMIEMYKAQHGADDPRDKPGSRPINWTIMSVLQTLAAQAQSNFYRHAQNRITMPITNQTSLFCHTAASARHPDTCHCKGFTGVSPPPKDFKKAQAASPEWLFTTSPNITSTHCMQASNHISSQIWGDYIEWASQHYIFPRRWTVLWTVTTNMGKKMW